MDSFFVEAQSAHPVCGRKEGGEARRWRSESCAARREGAESGVVWNEKERRCVIEARGESKKRAGESKNKGRAIEKQGIAESKRRGRNPKERGGRNPKASGHGIRKRAICPPPCRDEGFG